MIRRTFFRRHLAWPLAAVLFSFGAQAQEKNTDWPLVFTSGGDQVQVFKPQPESFDGTSFTARAAVALQRPQDTSPIFGAIWGNGILAVDRSDRMGTLTTFKVTDARFPGITDPAEQDRIREMLSQGIPAHAAPIAIDWLVAALEEEKQSSASYDNAPPTIIYKDKPSILLFIDGEPIYEKVKSDTKGGDPVYAGTTPELERVANTPFLLVRPKGGMNWLYGSGLWYSAKTVQGPWTYEKKAPAALVALAQKVDTVGTPQKAVDGIIPEVVVTTKPAVLLDINGAPQMQPFDNTSLMYVTNTDKDVFLDIPTQEYYFLASGRWYAAKDMKNGPWRYVSPEELPADFAKVPEGSAKDGILAHVAGTNAAREAVRDAAIPQTAQVSRSNVSLQVTYDGDPQFQQIGGTAVYSAVNASTTVLRINGHYYVCDNAVWYDGNNPDGPWVVSTSVPSQVNDIPPSDPNYRVRYVYIYDSTPDNVFVGYTTGYLGSYVQDGTVIYGTGYYYDPWRNNFWYPRPYTWGFNMAYNPWYGWGFGSSWGYDWFYPRWNYYGYYNPHAWGWWGPYGYCPGSWNNYGYGQGYGYGHYYGHSNNDGNGTRHGHRGSFGGSSGSRTSSGLRNNDLYTNHRVTGVRPSVVDQQRTIVNETTRSTERANGTKGTKAPDKDVFIDRNGNVFRSDGERTEELRDGKWATMPDNAGQDRTTPDRTNGRDGQITNAPGGRTPTTQPSRDNTIRERQPATREPGNTQPERPNTNTGRQPQTAPERSPYNTPDRDPQRIQQERSRGDQRVNDFRGYEQQRNTAPPQRTAPPMRQSAPTRTAPSAPPMRSAPSSPSRGSGGNNGGNSGGNSGGRRPR